MHEPTPTSQLYGQVRFGRVSSVDKKAHTVQVQFEEGDGFVSWDLHVLVTRPGDYSLPKKDTPVLCLLIESRLSHGYVLGAVYTEADAPPLDDDGKRSIAGDDIRLGDPSADKKVALAPKVKDELDKIKDEIAKIKTTLSSISGGITTTAAFVTPYTGSYSPGEVAAENVSAK